MSVRFQGSSSWTRLTGWSAICSMTRRRYASGSKPCSFAVSIRLQMAAARPPPASDPAKVQLRHPRAIGRIARSAAELSMQARPSRRINVRASQRASVQRIAAARVLRPETRRRVASSHAFSSAISRRTRFWATYKPSRRRWVPSAESHTRRLQELLVNQPHHCQIQRRLPERTVVEPGPADRDPFAAERPTAEDVQAPSSAASARAHRPEAFAKIPLHQQLTNLGVRLLNVRLKGPGRFHRGPARLPASCAPPPRHVSNRQPPATRPQSKDRMPHTPIGPPRSSALACAVTCGRS
jgi:hypothetical protein